MKKLLLITALLVCTLAVQAQLLWKVSGNGLKQASYIFGTHHIAPLSICDSIKGFEKAFAECGQLYGEVIMDSMTTPGFQQEMMIAMMAPQDSLLDKLYTPEDLKLIDQALIGTFGVGADKFNMLKPTAISTQLAVMQSMKIFKDFNPQVQLDGVLQKRAKEQGKPIAGFETVQFQKEMLFLSPISEQAEGLLKMVKLGDEKNMNMAREMADNYMKQDLDKLMKIIEDPELGSTEEDLNRLIYNRNQNWATQLKTILPEKATFIVVGGGHLPGEKGLLNLLRRQGYLVKAIQ